MKKTTEVLRENVYIFDNLGQIWIAYIFLMFFFVFFRLICLLLYFLDLICLLLYFFYLFVEKYQRNYCIILTLVFSFFFCIRSFLFFNFLNKVKNKNIFSVFVNHVFKHVLPLWYPLGGVFLLFVKSCFALFSFFSRIDKDLKIQYLTLWKNILSHIRNFI